MYMYTIDQPFSCRNSRGNINIQIYIWFLSKCISLHFSALWWRKWLKLPSWHTRTHLSCKFISVAVNVLVKSEVRATAAIVLISTLEPIRFSARGGFNSWIANIIDNSWRGSQIFVKIYILHWRGGVISAWKLMGVCRWPLKIGPKKIEEKIEFGAKKIDLCKNW